MMRLPPFRYLAPQSLEEAARLLTEHGPEAAVVAGGTDLFPNMKQRQQTPTVVIGLRRIAELRESRNGSGASLGAAMTLAEVARSPLLSVWGSDEDSPATIRVKNTPTEMTWAEFWKVWFMPPPAPRAPGGRLFMTAARLGEANIPIEIPLSASTSANIG